MSGRMDQPTTLRLNKSITTARNIQLSSVAMYVMSPVQAWLGPAGVKLRFNKFGEIGRSCRLSVVTTRKRRLPRARMPCFCISRWTRRLPTPMPHLTSSRQMRGQPYAPRNSAYNALMCASNAASLKCRRRAIFRRREMC